MPTYKKLEVVALLLLAAAGLLATDKSKYQTGRLLDITHQDSSRVVGNGDSVTSVIDREYDISVEVDGMTYVGSYWPRWRWSYEPTEFVVNTTVQVRLTPKEMFILRADKKELRTKIIKRIASTLQPSGAASSQSAHH
jgi:hypothetical protein